MRSSSVAVLVLAAACGHQEAPEKPPDTAGGSGSAQGSAQEATVESWSKAVDGIRIKVEPPAPRVSPGDVAMKLVIENTGDQPRRVYMLAPEIFRATLSDLLVLGADGKVIASAPEPHPHGYLPQESDFPEIAAHAQLAFAQTVTVPAGTAGPITIRWSYRNPVRKWEGGVQTLDGPTKPLFGGKDIPGIWVGELVAEIRVDVAP